MGDASACAPTSDSKKAAIFREVEDGWGGASSSWSIAFETDGFARAATAAVRPCVHRPFPWWSASDGAEYILYAPTCSRCPPVAKGPRRSLRAKSPMAGSLCRTLGRRGPRRSRRGFMGGAEGDAPVSALANWATSVYAHLLPFTGSTAVKIADARSDWTASARIRTQLPVLMDAPFNGTTLITRQTASGVSSGNTRYWPFSVAAREPEGRQSFSAIVPISAF